MPAPGAGIVMSLRLAGLHLFVLSAFAFAQPLFDLLGKNAEFFGARGSTGWDVVLFALTLLLVPPALLLGLEAVTPRRARPIVHAVFIAALLGLIVLQAIRAAGAPGWLLVVLAALAGAGAAALYVRFDAARLVLTVLAPVPLVFLALFLLQLGGLRLDVLGHANRQRSRGAAAGAGGDGRVRRAAGELAARRTRPDRCRSLPPFRRARARLDVVRERERRLGRDPARRPVAPDRPVPASGRAADLPRPPTEPVHAARLRRAAARLRDGDAPLPAEALPRLGRLARRPAWLALRGHERRLPARAPAGRPRERHPVGLERLAGVLAERRWSERPRAALRPLPADDPAGPRTGALVPPFPAAAQPVALPAGRAALRAAAAARLERRGGLEREPGGGRPVLAAAPAPTRLRRPTSWDGCSRGCTRRASTTARCSS